MYNALVSVSGNLHAIVRGDYSNQIEGRIHVGDFNNLRKARQAIYFELLHSGRKEDATRWEQKFGNLSPVIKLTFDLQGTFCKVALIQAKEPGLEEIKITERQLTLIQRKEVNGGVAQIDITELLSQLERNGYTYLTPTTWLDEEGETIDLRPLFAVVSSYKFWIVKNEVLLQIPLQKQPRLIKRALGIRKKVQVIKSDSDGVNFLIYHKGGVKTYHWISLHELFLAAL